MTQKTLIIIACVLAVVGGGVYAFFTNPSAQAPGMVVVPVTTLQYQNAEYGFSFLLPGSWKGHAIVTSTWEGLYPTQVAMTKEVGPMLSIRHPLWTKENPRQDIPIMIFTVQQWNDLQAEKFHIGAAPIGPSELGRNAMYVFGLPARYNFAYPTGYEEVDTILSAKPLQVLNTE